MRRSDRLLLLVASTLWGSMLVGACLRPGDTFSCALVSLACLFLWRRRGAAIVSIAFCAAGLAAFETGSVTQSRCDRPQRIFGRIERVVPQRQAWLVELRTARTHVWRLRVPRHELARLDRFPKGFSVGCRAGALITGGQARVGSASSFTSIVPAAQWGVVRRLGDELLRKVRSRAERVLADPSRPDVTSLFAAALTGDRSQLSDELVQDLRDSGMAHFAVMSGLHVGLVVFFVCSPIASWLGTRHPAIVSATAALGGTMLVLFPAAAPIARAASAVSSSQGARLRARNVSPVSCLAGLVVVLLCLRPAWAGSWSLSISVSATAALLLAIALPIPISRVGRWVLVASMPALASWPWVVLIAGRVAPWGCLLSAIAAPCFALSLALGLAAVACPLDGLAWFLAELARNSAAAFLQLVAWGAELPASGWIAAPSGAVWLALQLAVSFGAILQNDRRRLLAGLMIAIGVSAWPLRPLANRSPALAVLDVGQGQAVLVSSGEDSILIDAGDGRAPTNRALLSALRQIGSRRLRALVITHADLDHRGGAELLLRALRVERVAIPFNVIDHPAMQPLLARAARKGVPVIPIAAGESLRLGRVHARALHPGAAQVEPGNETSLVLEITTDRVRALLPADAGDASQARWLAAAPSDVDVLLVAHHGAAGATSNELLERTNPRFAFVSCGARNRFGHPHPDVQRRLRQRGLQPRSTARYGTIGIERAEARWQLSFKPRRTSQ